jgi:hypothetical protein
MALDELLAICTPPSSPRHARGDWQLVEQQLGPLPPDYKSLVETYGAGTFGGFLHVWTPFTPNRHVELRAAGAQTLAADRESRAKFPAKFTMKLHPEPGGLLPCGATDNGDGLYWITGGEPTTWRMFVLPDRELAGQHFEHDLTGFITAWFAGRLACECFSATDAMFEPSRA